MSNFLNDIDNRIVRAMRSLGKSVEAEIVKAVPNVTGNLRNSITNSAVRRQGSAFIIEISMVEYGKWVNEGTGLFGPHKQRIFPKKAKALRTPYGPRKSIKGMEGRQFVEKALEIVQKSGEIEQELDKYLNKP